MNNVREVALSSNRLMVDVSMLPELLGILTKVQSITGYGSTEQAEILSFDVKLCKPIIAETITERERLLMKEKEESDSRWYRTYTELEALKKERTADNGDI